MERLVCIDVPNLLLQVLLRERPELRDTPVVVVTEDLPGAEILESNALARESCILPGMRYSAGLSLNRELRASTVSSERAARVCTELNRRLQNFSPRVDSDPVFPGVFWLSGRGLGGLYESVNAWVDAIRTDMVRAGFDVNLCAGFSRFGTRAVARLRTGVTLFRTPEEEKRLASSVPLRVLDIHPGLRDTFIQLGVRTVGELCALPPSSVRARFGAEAAELRLQAGNDLSPPVGRWEEQSPPSRRFHFEEPLRGVDQLLFALKSALPSLLRKLRRRDSGVSKLDIRLEFDLPAGRQLRDRQEAQTQPEQPRSILLSASPSETTLDEELLMTLLRLRLERCKFPGHIEGAEIRAYGDKLCIEQTQLFSERPRRNVRDAERVLAELTAELGADAVVLRLAGRGHLPEAGVHSTSIRRLGAISPQAAEAHTLIRRIFDHPHPLESPGRNVRSDGWLIRGERSGPVRHLVGPYRISGGWWHVEIQREYHYALLGNGSLLWVYRDRLSGGWEVQGLVL